MVSSDAEVEHFNKRDLFQFSVRKTIIPKIQSNEKFIL